MSQSGIFSAALRRRAADCRTSPSSKLEAELEAGLEQQPVALLGALGCRGAIVTRLATSVEHALEVGGQEAALAARRALAG